MMVQEMPNDDYKQHYVPGFIIYREFVVYPPWGPDLTRESLYDSKDEDEVQFILHQLKMYHPNETIYYEPGEISLD